MRILAIESSALACSAALCEGEKLIACAYQNGGLTHSRTLMPMVDEVLTPNGGIEGVDVIAVACGPGSFTGLRIGVSAAKGLAWAAGKPCAPCSTLASMAWQVAHTDGLIVPVMDARRDQVYNALFRARSGVLERLCPDRAIGLAQLGEELKKYSDDRKILVGDGAQLCYNTLRETCGLSLAPEHLRWQSAWGVAREAMQLAASDRLVDGAVLRPAYHRLSQAERERLAKTKE